MAGFGVRDDAWGLDHGGPRVVDPIQVGSSNHEIHERPGAAEPQPRVLVEEFGGRGMGARADSITLDRS